MVLHLRRVERLVWAATLIMLVIAAFGCSRDAAGKRNSEEKSVRPANPVSVAEVLEKTVPIQIKAVGTTEAFSTVSVRAQVAGELIAVHIKDGQCVKVGDPLFTIDPRPFETELRQVKANLEKEKAQLDYAQKQLDRNASVVGKGYVSQEQYDQVAANAAALKAAVAADQAAVENAQIQLKYCWINSPIDGCAGELKIHPGNLIKVSDTEYPLVVIKQISPIYVSFYIPEKYLPEVQKYMAAKKLEVQAAIPNLEDNPNMGQLSFLDNSVNKATGTIQLKATFPNKDRSLWPGQYVNVTLTLATQPNAVVVPSQAVKTGQEGQYIFVVRPDLTAEYRLVEVQRILGGDAIISKGVRPGEKVVTDGQLRLSPDSPVKIVDNTGARKGESL